MKGFIIFTVAFVVVSLLDVAQAGHGKGMKCDGQDMKKADDEKEMHAGMKACMDKYAPAAELQADATDDDKKKAMKTRWMSVRNNTCFMVCKLQVDKIFDSNGAFSQADADARIEKMYPTTELATQMKEGIKKCAEGQTFSMDNECSSSKDFMTCMHKKHFEICKLDEKTIKQEMDM